MSLKEFIDVLGNQAKTASMSLRNVSTEQKNRALLAIAQNIGYSRNDILKANQLDVKNAQEKNLSDALIDRLLLNEERIDSIIQSLNQIALLEDPVGEITDLKYRPSGIQVGKMRVPLGVLGIIYESRPNVTIDASALCLKSSNAVILRGGSESINSNQALYKCIQDGLKSADLNVNCVQLVDTTDRDAVTFLVSNENVDAIIPRGGKGLVSAISESSRVPVIKHLDGICHTYIDNEADIKKAVDVAFNGKTRRYGVCNATETLLVHQNAPKSILENLVKRYTDEGVELRGCKKALKLFSGMNAANDDDWSTEYLAPILSIKIVENIDQAIKHIEKYGSGHTESIVTENISTGRYFLNLVDSSSVMINASTGFADGGEYGLGAEIGISTDKFHVRGPVGLEGLTSQKYIVIGNGHIRG